MGWRAPENDLLLPNDTALRLAAVIAATVEGELSLQRAVPVLASLPTGMAGLMLTEALPLLPPMDEGSVDDLLRLCKRLGGQPIQRTRLVRAALRAAVAVLGVDVVRPHLALPDDPWLRDQVIASCAEELLASGIDRDQLLSSLGHPKSRLIARAALLQHSADPRDELQQIAAEISRGLSLDQPDALEVLEAIPAPLRPAVIDQTLGDGFLDGRSYDRHLGDLWADTLKRIVPELDERQLRVVEDALDAKRRGYPRIGAGPSSELRAEIAIRWVYLENFPAFRSSAESISLTEYFAEAMTRTVLHVSPEHLASWYAMTGRLKPEFDTRERAMLFALARNRWRDLDHNIIWNILDHWLHSSTSGQDVTYNAPWQVAVDLLGYGPAITTISAPQAAMHLHDLVTGRMF
jgi:hypothetical protein